MSKKKEKENIKKFYQIKETENRWRELFASSNADIGSMISSIYGANIGSAFGNNPFIANKRVQNIATKPHSYLRDNIEDAMLDPANHELLLRGATHNVLNQTYPLYRLQYLYEGILSYHHYVQPMYVDKEGMKKKSFKRDELFIDNWIKKLNPKKTFRRIVSQVLAEGKRAYILRQKYKVTDDKRKVDYVMLQDVPSDWFRITGITDESYYSISFDFFYFTTPGSSLEHFPPFFTEMYNKLMGYKGIDSNGDMYIDIDSMNEVDGVTIEYDSLTGTWAYWAEIPANIAWTFCFTEADANAISPFISLLLMGSDLADYNLLQQQLVAAPLSSIILGEMGIDSDTNKSGWSADNYSISPAGRRMFETEINNALQNSNIAFKMTPSIKNQIMQIPNIPNAQTVYNEAIKGIINTSGSGAMQSLSEKPSVAQTNMAKIYEGRYIDRIYAQFEHFVNTTLEDMYYSDVLKNKWKFTIFGNTFLDRDEYKDLETSLSMGQVHLLPRYLAMKDMSIVDANCMADYIQYSGIYDKMQPLVSSFTASKEDIESSSTKVEEIDKKPGRPEAVDSDNDNTDLSKNLGASNAREE